MRPTLIKLRGAKYPLLFLSVITLIVIVLVPLIMIFLEGLVKAYGLPLIPENFTLENFQNLATSKATMDSIRNSLFLSILWIQSQTWFPGRPYAPYLSLQTLP